mmetsp:Transcript_144700/g.252232  ORF Transcript_144700/g.252232 Transcript_144700/m.252232 type:complete len:278 (-) Transcript_144700:1551-2384(-)
MLVEGPAHVDGQASGQRDDAHLDCKLPGLHEVPVEVRWQHDNGKQIGPEREQLRKHEEKHAPGVHLDEDHVELREDEGGEGDAHDLQEGLGEEEDDEQHDDTALVNGHPQPLEERFDAESPSLLQLGVQLGEQEDKVLRDILVHDQAEDGQHSVHGGVPDHQPARVDGDGGEVEDGRKDGLDEGDDQAPMEDELRKRRGPQVRVSAVPEDERLAMGELSQGEVCGKCRVLALFANDPEPAVRCLDHGHVVPTVPDGCHTLAGIVFHHQAHDLRLLRR